MSPEWWDGERVEGIFSSGATWFPRSCPSEYARLAETINDGVVTVVRFEYVPVPEPERNWEHREMEFDKP